LAIRRIFIFSQSQNYLSNRTGTQAVEATAARGGMAPQRFGCGAVHSESARGLMKLKKYNDRPNRKRARFAGVALAATLCCMTAAAHAQEAVSDAPLPTTKSPPPVAAPSGFSGPLASFAAPLFAEGISFHAVALNFSEANPSLGLAPGHAANSLYVIEGVDADLGKLMGLAGTSLHFENMFFPATENLNIAPQIGDSQVGYQPPFTPRIARLSRATIEQKLLDNRLDVEVGMTHPGYYYALFNCSSINTCFQDMLYLNAGYTSYGFAVPGGNVHYAITPSIYVEAGAFAVQPSANYHVGYDLPDETYDGVLVMSEIGRKTDFSVEPYPWKISLTGFVNTANHSDDTAATAFTGAANTVPGTSGIVLQGEKVVWRQDNGFDLHNKAPMALKLYGSFGWAFDSTIPVQGNTWIGATLMSPFAGRPNDTYGLKFNWQHLNASYTNYLTAANFVSGGPGYSSPYQRDSYIFEANAHLQLPMGTAFEPVVQYEVNPNSYFNPLTPVKARNGVYVGGTFVIPLGTLLGFQAAT
jgi:porin